MWLNDVFFSFDNTWGLCTDFPVPITAKRGKKIESSILVAKDLHIKNLRKNILIEKKNRPVVGAGHHPKAGKKKQ
jgi:hypothetical protein